MASSTPDRASTAASRPGTVTATVLMQAEIKVAKGATAFFFEGISSGIGLVALDPVVNVSGAVCTMLPVAYPQAKEEDLGRYADTGISKLLSQMVAAGATATDIRIAYVGGASLNGTQGSIGAFDVGTRNAIAVEQALGSIRLTVKATAVGGNTGRSLTYDSVSGKVIVKTLLHGESELCSLRDE